MSMNRISPQSFIEKAKPLMAGAYQTALLITDDADAAEDALGAALLDVYLDGAGGDKRALRDKLRHSVKVCAMEQAGTSRQGIDEGGDWSLGTAHGDNPLYEALLMRPRNAQRYLMLRGFAGINAGKAASMCGLDARTARLETENILKSVPGGNEREFNRLCRGILAAPDLTGVFRSFEKDAVMTAHRHRGSRLLGFLLALAGILICMLLFWIMTVLLEPGRGV